MKKEKITVSEFLKERGVRPSNPRVKIYEYLCEKKNHPSVDIIYTALKDNLPCLSRTTVYNTLNLFLEKEIVRQVIIEDNEARYDADTSVHGHFRCDKCGRIYDFRVEEILIKDETLKKFTIKEKHIYFRGNCDKCLNSN
jgi:Fe2+ or Zn2+ uptake regulation protein